ncbi:hypothetical protein BGZ91_011600, partial [Linnemannia elongata]
MTNAPVVSPLGTPTEHDNLKGVDRLRQKFRPALLYVVSLVEFINIVNGSSVAVAILPIAQDLKFSVTEVLWIINALE